MTRLLAYLRAMRERSEIAECAAALGVEPHPPATRAARLSDGVTQIRDARGQYVAGCYRRVPLGGNE
jgi:hypothetical protein